MSLFRPERRDANLSALIAAQGTRTGTAAKIPVNDETALRHSTVWQCVDLLSDLVSQLPVGEYRKGPNGERIALPPPALLDDPAGDGTGYQMWLRQVMVSELLRGNAYGLVLQIGQDGWPTQIETVHPDRVDWHRTRNMGPAVSRLDGKEIDRWPRGPLWHLPALVVPGSPVGLSPIRYAAEGIGLGLAAQRFGAQWFGDGAHPTSVATTDQPVDETQATVVKERIKAALNGNREPLVLGAGVKLDAIQIAPEESQFLETVQANVATVAGYFRVPPELVGGKSGDSMTYGNVEARILHFLTFTLSGWLVRVEQSLTRLRPRPRFVKFNADALVRVDLLTRMKVHDMGIRGGWRNVDEVRRFEDEPPLPDGQGQAYLWPPYATRTDTAPTEGDTNERPPQPS